MTKKMTFQSNLIDVQLSSVIISITTTQATLLVNTFDFVKSKFRKIYYLKNDMSRRLYLQLPHNICKL